MLLYNKPKDVSSYQSFASKHRSMIRLSGLAELLFNILTCIINKKTKYEYTMEVKYDGAKLLIRPFVFTEIIMVSGQWEPYVKYTLDRELQHNDNSVVVNVGANIGIYAIPLARRVKKVIAFEPHPLTSKILEKSIEMNNLKNIILVKKAVGDSQKRVTYNIDKVPMLSKIVPQGENTNITLGNVMVTETVDLDTYLKQEVKIDWLIIDAEGFEANVLNGAKKILRNNKPKIIVEAYKTDEVKDILIDEGYTVKLLYDKYYYATT
jgi:FkbM family methyltransferase